MGESTWVSAGGHPVPEATAAVTPYIIMCFLKRKNLLSCCDGFLPVYTRKLFQLFCDLLSLQGFHSRHLCCLGSHASWLPAKTSQWKKPGVSPFFFPLRAGSSATVVSLLDYFSSLLAVLAFCLGSSSPVVCSNLAAVANL